MKKNIFVILCGLGLLSQGFADVPHQHSNAATNGSTSAGQNTIVPGACEIEIVNNSFDDINIYGRFEDGTYLTPFIIKHWGVPQTVSLYYYGSCHQGMDFYIETAGGNYKYSGFTPVGKVIKINGF